MGSRRRERARPSGPAGFSLVELLVAVVLLGIAAASFYGIYQRARHSLSRGEDVAEMQQSSRAALQAAVAELRTASGMVELGSDEVVFVSDRFITGQERRLSLDTDDQDGDGSTSELLLSRWPGDDGSPGPVIDEVAEGIGHLGFRYLGEGTGSGSDDEVDEPLAVRRVEISVRGETGGGGGGGERSLFLSSQVRPRNLGLPIPAAADSLPPSAPTGLTGTPNCGTAGLRWNQNPETDVVGYRLHYDTDLAGPPYQGTGADQGNSPIWVGSDTTYALSGLDITATYYLAVTAKDAQGLESGYSSSISLVPNDWEAPPTPAGVGVRLLDETSVVVSWNEVSAPDIAFYRVYYDTEDLDGGNLDEAQQDTSYTTTHVLQGLTPGVTYYIGVSAVDACYNESPLSEVVTVRPAPCDGDTFPPAAPTGFDGIAGDGSVDLWWNESPEIDLAGYRLYVTGPSLAGSLSVGLVTSYSLGGLANDETYRFYLSALDVCDNVSARAGPLDLTPTSCAGDSFPPAKPRGLTLVEDLSPEGDRLTISWTANEESDLAGYVVHYWDSYGWTDSLEVGLEIFATITGLTTGETYYMVVVAYDRCDNYSDPSDVLEGIPRAPCHCNPVVTIETPRDGTRVSDLIALLASAVPCSTADIREVIFYFDADEVAHFYSPPYMTWYNTSIKDDGDYMFKAEVYDILGCEGADSVIVTINNSTGPPPCAQVDPTYPYVLGGDYHQEVTFGLMDMDPVGAFNMFYVFFEWDRPEARLRRIEIPTGWQVWDAGGYVEDAVPSGTLVGLDPHVTLNPGERMPTTLYFWNAAGDTLPGGRENMPLDGATIVGTFVGSSGEVCGPDTVMSDCRIYVSNISATSGSVYEVAMLDEGDRYYTDRNRPLLTNIPDQSLEGSFEGLVWIKTPDFDRDEGDGFRLEFDINQNAVLYVGYDQRYAPPNWIRDDFQRVMASIGVNDWPGRFILWKKNVDAGTVTLYGNYGIGWGNQGTRNYMVLLRCRGEGI